MAYLVGALIFADFLTHQENIWVTLKFFPESFVECLAIGDFSHAFFSVAAAVPAADSLEFAGDTAVRLSDSAGTPASTAPSA